MARNPWDDDPDVAAMRSMRPRGSTSWGRILFGVLLVACGTFAFAYYLPLHRAHSALVGDHDKLRRELESAQSSVKQAQNEAKTLREQKEELQAAADKRDSAKQSAGAGAEAVRSAVLAAIDKAVKKKQAVAAVEDDGVRAGIAPGFLLTNGKLDVSAGGKDALCALAKASGTSVLRVSAVAADDDVPAALKAKIENGWAYAGATAASVAHTLESSCAVARTRISLGTPSTAASFMTQSPPTPRVEILVTAGKP
jgi:F0F1-type ATP synthase membrane subunit b/b'